MVSLVHHLLHRSAERAPEKEALVHGRERWRYRELAAAVSGLAAGLRTAGIERQDRVGIYLPASVAQVVSIFGASESGAVFVPINDTLRADQVVHIVNDCAIRALVTSRARLAQLAPRLADMPSIAFAVITDDEPAGDLPWPSHRLWELCRGAGAPAGRCNQSISPDLAAILYTSGSTGKPKGVMLSHANVLAGARIVSTYLEITGADRILAVLPFSFDAGLNQLTTSMERGATLVLINFVFAREIVQTLLRERVTGLAGVPTLWSLLAQPSSTLARQPLPHLRYITNTGGAMPQPVLKELRQLLPTTRIFLMYGLTEAFRSTYLPPEELDRRPTSMGKAIPDTEILVIDEDGRPCKPGEVGELVHRGPTVSMGYWGRPEDTRRVLRPHPLASKEVGDAERVCYSGDLVRMDEDGFLYFVGRRDGMIKSSGFRISPTEVEEALFSSGALGGAAVIGVPDEMLGQTIKAYVVPHDGGRVDVDALVATCAERLPSYMVPRAIEVIDALPKTSSGKVDYPALRQRAGAAR
jgi:acyl-CoA ligase (AMP-forming) (exosortase A-associated)